MSSASKNKGLATGGCVDEEEDEEEEDGKEVSCKGAGGFGGGAERLRRLEDDVLAGMRVSVEVDMRENALPLFGFIFSTMS